MPRSTLYLIAILAGVILVMGGFYWALTRPPQPPAQPVQPETIPASSLQHFEVFLHRKPCLGACPVYAVLVKGASGSMKYVGSRNVAITGTETAPVTVGQLASLYRAVRHAEFFSIEDVYHNGPGGTGCTELAADAPRAVIGVTRDARTKVIHYDYGCGGAPAALKKLANKIDRILNTARWVQASTG
ncbi:MAG TPA: DUF6438 domain-containing protein [Gammaproteobacteria bacterium]|nr:DUF6438 domain-containing protein [Gammaproteobacteria bacterium]